MPAGRVAVFVVTAIPRCVRQEKVGSRRSLEKECAADFFANIWSQAVQKQETVRPRMRAGTAAYRTLRLNLSYARRFGVYGGIAFLFLIAALLQPSLLRPGQLLSMTRLASVLGIAALGQTFVTISRGFDISQGGLITLTIVLSNMVMNGNPHNIFAGVVVCLLAGLVLGLINGLFVTFFRVPSIIATLGTFSVALGGAVIYSGGVPTGSIPKSFQLLGSGNFIGIPISSIVWAVLTVVAALYLHKTVVGRSLFARGSNEVVAHQSGINVRWYGVLPYILSSVSAAVAGLVFAAYMGLPDLQAGSEYMLAPIAAAVVGGTSLAGGEGTMLGSSAGAFFLTFLSALIISFNLPEGVKMMITGAIIVAAIYLSQKENA